MTTRVEQGATTTTYTPDTTHKHAVKQAGANYFCYDANGNMMRRNATSAACSNGIYWREYGAWGDKNPGSAHIGYYNWNAAW